MWQCIQYKYIFHKNYTDTKLYTKMDKSSIVFIHLTILNSCYFSICNSMESE